MNDSLELKAQNEEHNKGGREERDPAEENGEGLRVIEVDGALAVYEIAQLPDGRYALIHLSVTIAEITTVRDHRGLRWNQEKHVWKPS